MAKSGVDASIELVANLRLSMVSGVGPRIQAALLERFGDADGVLSAALSDLRDVPGVGPQLAQRIANATETIDVTEELQTCREQGVGLLTPDMPAYPRSLREIHDPPQVLYLQGELLPHDALAVAIVGSRHATQYGQRQAGRLAGSLARAGFTVISGLARGIDAAAHRGALEAGGRTLAVLGSGVLNVYPPEHRELAWEIRGQGAVISELPTRFPPRGGAFPQRNRIISGLALGVVVVEAGSRSGALITARLASEQGREVFAVPGPVDSRASRGCHALLRDGATLVEDADDVLAELGPLVEPAADGDGRAIHHPAELQLNAVEQDVLQAVGQEPTGIDAIVTTTDLPIQRVLGTISVLEMRRLVRTVGGNRVVRR